MTETNAPDEDLPPLPQGIRAETIQRLPFALVISDSSLPDNPIVYVNAAFVEQTGYAPDRALGRNCRFLQGENTEPDAVQALRDAIRADREVTVDILNYRTDGSHFVNRLMVAPLYEDDGSVRYYLGIQHDTNDVLVHADRAIELTERLREMQHRMKNHLSMLLALIRIEARRQPDPTGTIDVLAARVESLALLYQQIENPGELADDRSVALGVYVRRLCGAVEMLSPSTRIGVDVEVETFEVPVDQAARVGLLLCEILTNALRHAYGDTVDGEIRVSLVHEDDADVLCVADDGAGLGEALWPDDPNTLGGLIARDLVARLDATLEVDSSPSGTTVTVRMPRLGVGPRLASADPE